MKLSARSRYAARLLLALSMHEAGIPMSTSLLSDETGITVQFIEQIIRPLKQAGLISSVRGASGGHLLNKNPQDITLGQIVRIMEGSTNIVNCLECDTNCERAADCKTRSAWERASRAMEHELDSISLAELIDTPAQSDPTE